MNRIERIFADLRGRGAKALMPFITAGDPDVPTTVRLLNALEDAGASICELGIPFSDPIADGPVIQESMTWALDHGVRVGQVFDAVAAVRGDTGLGLVAMVSYSIVHRLGAEAFADRARASGFDGLIFPDLPLEEAEPVRAVMGQRGLTLSLLVAPSTPADRVRRIGAASSGFVYVVSRKGITGESQALPPDLPARLEQIRGATELPIAVGFGVSSAEQVRQVVSVADAAIVGSAVVRRIAQRRGASAEAIAAEVSSFTRELADGLAGRAAVGR